MDYLAQTSPQALLGGAERRKSPRKTCRRPATVGTAAQGIIRGDTCDISVGGLSVMLPIALAVGTQCAVRFELFIDGVLVRVAGEGCVMNCSCSGLNGFRIGMNFKVPDAKVQTLLSVFAAK